MAQVNLQKFNPYFCLYTAIFGYIKLQCAKSKGYNFVVLKGSLFPHVIGGNILSFLNF